MENLSAFSARPRLAALLDHFAEITVRVAWRVISTAPRDIVSGRVRHHL